jgi:prepilin-type processing-associated H-X9-DG protein
MGILMPVLMTSRAKSEQIVCESNIRQLHMANAGYANQNEGSYVAAALDIFGANKHRWHSRRDNTDSPFLPSKGPLAAYLGDVGLTCPGNVNFEKINPSQEDYDEGGGGYGYNMIYLGSRIWSGGYEDKSCRVTTKDIEVRRPSQTLMFADTAMARPIGHIEYSFAEPRYFLIKGKPEPIWTPSPSIHFRHRGQANVGWADGHISSEKMADFDGVNEDGIRPAEMGLGWFEPMDNTMFDLH